MILLLINILAYKNGESITRGNLHAQFLENTKSENFISEVYNFSRTVGGAFPLTTEEFNLLCRKLFSNDDQRIKLPDSTEKFIIVAEGMNLF